LEHLNKLCKTSFYSIYLLRHLLRHMKTFKEPTHFFNLNTRPTTSGEHLIFFNLNYGYSENSSNSERFKYVPMRISTSFKIRKEHWDNKNYCATPAYVRMKGKSLNDTLDKIRITAYAQLNIFRDKGIEPEPKELKRIIEEKLGRKQKVSTEKLLIPFIQNYIENRIDIKKETKKQYDNLVRHLKQYEQIRNTKLVLGKLTIDWYWDFFDVINKKYYEDEGVYLTQTTIAKDCKNLRAIFNEAIECDIEIGFNYRKKGLKINEKPKSYETFLNQTELQTILDSDVSHMKSFTHARNYIIISSFTSLRISDMKYLNEITPETIDRNGTKCLLFFTKIRKNKEVNKELFACIPILKPVKELLDANGGTFPKFPSEQVLRRYIKSYLKHLEFDEQIKMLIYYYNQSSESTIQYKAKHELFSPHDCRATFITNLKQLGLHNETIEPITHPKVDAKEILNKYDKSDLVDNAIKFNNAINSINEMRKNQGLEDSLYRII
jgi:hypothetical protein